MPGRYLHCKTLGRYVSRKTAGDRMLGYFPSLNWLLRLEGNSNSYLHCEIEDRMHSAGAAI
jgi:hypothetical protein